MLPETSYLSPFLVRALLEQHPHPILSLHETGLRWGKPPSFWLGGDGSWTEHDKVFVQAVTLYQQALCPSCGMPDKKCKSTNWTVQTRICGPEAAVETWRKNHKELEPGTQVTPVPMASTEVDAEQSAAAATAPDWVKAQFKT